MLEISEYSKLIGFNNAECQMENELDTLKTINKGLLRLHFYIQERTHIQEHHY